jgi:hypothetical protein
MEIAGGLPRENKLSIGGNVVDWQCPERMVGCPTSRQESANIVRFLIWRAICGSV